MGKQFKIKAVLTFNDGVLPGTLKVKAMNKEQAEIIAREKLKSLWANCLSIEIVKVS